MAGTTARHRLDPRSVVVDVAANWLTKARVRCI